MDHFVTFLSNEEHKFLMELFEIILRLRGGTKTWYETGINCYELALTYQERHRVLHPDSITEQVWEEVLAWKEDRTDMLEIAIGLLDNFLHGRTD